MVFWFCWLFLGFGCLSRLRMIALILFSFKNQLIGFHRSLKLCHNHVAGDFNWGTNDGCDVEVFFVAFSACREWWKLWCCILNLYVEEKIDFWEDTVIERSGIVGLGVNWNCDWLGGCRQVHMCYISLMIHCYSSLELVLFCWDVFAANRFSGW